MNIKNEGMADKTTRALNERDEVLFNQMTGEYLPQTPEAIRERRMAKRDELILARKISPLAPLVPVALLASLGLSIFGLNHNMNSLYKKAVKQDYKTLVRQHGDINQDGEVSSTEEATLRRDLNYHLLSEKDFKITDWETLDSFESRFGESRLVGPKGLHQDLKKYSNKRFNMSKEDNQRIKDLYEDQKSKERSAKWFENQRTSQKSEVSTTDQISY